MSSGDHAAVDQLAFVVAEQTKARGLAALQMASALLKLPPAARRRQAAFTLRCDHGCELAAIFGRSRIPISGGPPNNELLVCWTTRGFRADLNRWYVIDSFFDVVSASPVACKHGSGLFDIGAIGAFACHAGPKSQYPDTLFALGATRRLSDPIDGDGGNQLAAWSTARGRATLNKLSSDGWTVGQLALRESWRPKI